MAISRVIEVSFGRSSVALVRIDTAYFYNNGILFKPTDIDLPASYQVHWTDSPQASTTLETIGTAEGAPIPDDLWNRSRVIYGWIYLHPTENSAVTAYEVRIYKNVRAGLPDGTEPTPAEQSTIDQLISALNSAVEQAEDAEERIENMSVSATTLAEGASATVTKSEQDGVVHLAFGIPKGQTGDDGYSPTANVSKTGKVATITITDKNGTTSAQVEDGTDGIDGISPSVSVTDITGGHRVVITDKDGAKSFDVEDGATGATPNLTIGTVETLEPTESATATITGTPENPVLNLGIPQGDAGEVTLADLNSALIEKAPIITDTASGAIASFSDGADDLPLKSLVIDINPVQDLHGQDSPYPAGGGKNLLPPIETITNNGITFSQSGDYININGTATANAYVMLFSGVLPSGDYVINGMTGAGNSTWRVGIKIGDASWVYAGGNERTFTSDGTTTIQVYLFAYPAHGAFDNLKVQYQLERGTTPTSWSPYENLCPISGWTEIGVEQRGVNVWDEEWAKGEISRNGELIPDNTHLASKNFISVVPSSAYCLVGARAQIAAYNSEKTFLGIINSGYIGENGSNAVFNTTKNTHFIRFNCAATYGTTYNHDISINYPSSDHTYHPYTGRSITIQLGQTVYGGKLDVLSGELTVDRAMVVFDGTENYQNAYFPTVVCAKNIGNSGDYSRRAEIFSNYCSAPNVGFVMSTATTIQWKYVDQNFGVSSADELKALFAQYYADGNPMTVVYPLATPITIQLTPNQVNSLLGVNNIWADSGDTEVEYRADTKLFIERLTAPDSADMIADANITSGQYFMVGNTLYKATSNIANGAQIIVGTNVVRKSLSEALNEINA